MMIPPNMSTPCPSCRIAPAVVLFTTVSPCDPCEKRIKILRGMIGREVRVTVMTSGYSQLGSATLVMPRPDRGRASLVVPIIQHGYAALWLISTRVEGSKTGMWSGTEGPIVPRLPVVPGAEFAVEVML